MSIPFPHEDGRLLITTAAQQNTSFGGKRKGGLLSQGHGPRVLDIPAINKKENGILHTPPMAVQGERSHSTPTFPLYAAAASSSALIVPETSASQIGRLLV